MPLLISQQLRPNDKVRFPTAHYALAPIAGLQMQQPAVEILDLLLVRCNRAEWETAERGYVFKDWQAQYYSANPVFLVRMFDEAIEPERLDGILDDLARDGARLVTALRLYKTGPLIEPVYTARFSVSEGMRHRAIGPYRTEYLALPIDKRTWPLEPDEVQDVTLIYRNLKIMEASPNTDALQAIIDQFNLSQLPRVSAFFAVHVLFTLHEMLFDGIAKQLALVTTRFERALQLLRLSYGDSLDPEMESFYLEEVHALRNAVHHHTVRSSKSDLSKARLYLQLAAMLGIRYVMRFHQQEVDPIRASVSASNGWPNIGPKDFFNACLDRAVAGDYAPLNAVFSNSS